MLPDGGSWAWPGTRGSYPDHQTVEAIVRVRRDRQALLTRDNGGANDCVEVNRSPERHVGVRDPKLTTTSSVLAIPAAQWARVITAVRDSFLDA